MPGFLVMFDMWSVNSVTFTFSHSFIIVACYVIFISGLTIFMHKLGPSFLGVEPEDEDWSLLSALNLFLFAIVTHIMLYNINHYVKLGIIRKKVMAKREQEER